MEALRADPYTAFRDAVTRRQLRAWLPADPALALDVSGRPGLIAATLLTAGHTVLAALGHRADATRAAERPAAGGGWLPVRAEPRDLDWVAAASLDLVVAECGSFSGALAAEEYAHSLHRVLRPGGRAQLCAQSLLHGLARLAEQGRWAELADCPAADVVLVPTGAGDEVSRCFGADELVGLLTAAGLEVEDLYPRTVVAPSTVLRACDRSPLGWRTLVEEELRLAREHAGEATGVSLVVSVRRPG